MKKVVLLLFLAFFITGCAEKQLETSGTEVLGNQEISKAVQEASVPETEQPEKEEIVEEAPTPVAEVTSDWPTFHGDSARTGFSTSSAPSTANVLWKLTMNDFMKMGYDGSFDVNWPVIDENKVFFAVEEIFALDLKNGKKLWSFTDESINFYPRGITVGDKKVFVTVNNDDNLDAISAGFIYAFDEDTGNFLWKFKTAEGLSHSLPLWADDKVFVGDDSGQVYAVNGDNGVLLWKKRLEGAKVIHSSPAFDSGMIFIGTEDNIGAGGKPSYLYALDSESGDIIWKFEIDTISGKLNLVHSTPSVFEGVVYFGAENGYFYALSSRDGQLIWKQRIASGSGELVGASAAAALGYEKVFIGTFEGKFLALSQDDGKVLWEYSFGRKGTDSSPVLADKKVYFGSNEGYFYCFKEDTGEIIWKEKLGGSSAALASGILIVQNALAEDNFNLQNPVLIAFSDEGKLSLS